MGFFVPAIAVQRLIRVIPGILASLREHGFRGQDERPTSGWSGIAWYLGAHALLKGDTPAHWLGIDPERVLTAAHIEFIEESDAGGI